MKRAIFALLAVTLVAMSSGCCCVDRMFCWGCRGSCAYGNEGPCTSCGGGGCSSCGGGGGGGGYSGGGGGGGCSDCGMAGGSRSGGPAMAGAPRNGAMANRARNSRMMAQGNGQMMGQPPYDEYAGGGPGPGQGPGPGAGMRPPGYHPAHGHPFVKQRRDSDDAYEFAAGPPTGSVSYPYYTNRGPRDFLAKNPRSVGP